MTEEPLMTIAATPDGETSLEKRGRSMPYLRLESFYNVNVMFAQSETFLS